MSKGAYSIVAYPDSCHINDVLDRFRGSGASCMWILHDRDTDTKNHFHVAVGWESGFPSWKKFLGIRDVINAECYIGDSDKPSCFGKMMLEKCIVHDAEELRKYFLHDTEAAKQAGKYRYSDDTLNVDESWLGTEYNTVELQRRKCSAQKSADKASGIAAVIGFIRENKIDEWFLLLDRLSDDRPELFEVCLSNAYCIKSYLDSYRSSGRSVSDTIQPYKDRIAELEKIVSDYKNGNKWHLSRLQAEYDKLHVNFNEIASELDRTDWYLHVAVKMLLDAYVSFGDNPTYTDILDAIEKTPRTCPEELF